MKWLSLCTKEKKSWQSFACLQNTPSTWLLTTTQKVISLSAWNYSGTRSQIQFQSLRRERGGKDKIVPLNSWGNLISAALFIIFIYVVWRSTAHHSYAALYISWLPLYLLWGFFFSSNLVCIHKRSINPSTHSWRPVVGFNETREEAWQMEGWLEKKNHLKWKM